MVQKRLISPPDTVGSHFSKLFKGRSINARQLAIAVDRSTFCFKALTGDDKGTAGRLTVDDDSSRRAPRTRLS